jgi:hypothetical protein
MPMTGQMTVFIGSFAEGEHVEAEAAAHNPK